MFAAAAAAAAALLADTGDKVNLRQALASSGLLWLQHGSSYLLLLLLLLLPPRLSL
jgi:hypothetical protein